MCVMGEDDWGMRKMNREDMVDKIMEGGIGKEGIDMVKE